jgi:hypothetical protein
MFVIATLLLSSSSLLVNAEKKKYRPRNPHKATDVECRPASIFRRLNPKSMDHEAEYDLEKIIPDSLNGCHTLWLSDFELWDEGAIAIAEGLKGHKDVHTVYMHFSQVGDEGAEAFAELLKVNQDLHTINLGHNSIETEGAIHLAEALKVNTGLHTLTLDHNKIHEAGIIALIEALKINEDVLHMNVHSNHFNLQSPPHARELEDQIEALLHGHAFHHFHTSGEVEDRSEEELHTEHPLKHIEKHKQRVLNEGKDGKGGIDSHHGEPAHKMKPINRPHELYNGNGPPAAVHQSEL